MKLATFNLERPKLNGKKNSVIEKLLNEINADILVLTETNDCINLGKDYAVMHSEILDNKMYKKGERRVSIYSKYPIIKMIDTFNNQTSICALIVTPLGDLAVYGTIIGIYGNRRPYFMEDLDAQIKDFERISAKYPLCIAGDLNISFGDNYYFTKVGRDKLNTIFDSLNMTNTTASIPENIDHIALSNSMIPKKDIRLGTWNLDKTLSDHIGVSVTF